jgi:hypothetical protein
VRLQLVDNDKKLKEMSGELDSRPTLNRFRAIEIEARWLRNGRGKREKVTQSQPW